jgi:hypothetical protein
VYLCSEAEHHGSGKAWRDIAPQSSQVGERERKREREKERKREKERERNKIQPLKSHLYGSTSTSSNLLIVHPAMNSLMG